MGGKRVQIRSATAIATIILILASRCSGAIYRISSDELIEDDESPVTASPGWQWPSQDRTSSRPRTDIFPNRVPTWATEPPSEFPEAWKTALRRAAFQTLRHEAGLLLGYPGITSTVQSEVYRELWYRLSVAEFVGMKEYQDYDEEELQSDISTLAEGLLLDRNGDLQFYITRRKNSCACEGAKTLATWSIRRLRHSGPGRGEPQYQLRFSVVPKSDDRVIDLVSVRVESARPTSYPNTNQIPARSPSYRGIPIYKKSHNKEYNPQFINEYAQVISSYLQYRDNNPKRHPPEDNKNRDRIPNRNPVPNRDSVPNRDLVPNREQYSDYESIETSEEYTEPFSDTYSKYDPKETEEDNDGDEETSVEYDNNYRESSSRQESSRGQYHQYYRQQYSSYQAPSNTRQRYQQQQSYREGPEPYEYYQTPPITEEFRPSQPFQRYSESDPLYADNQRVDQKVLPQFIVTQHEKISTVYQTTQRPTTPSIQFFQEYQLEKIKDHKISDDLYNSETVKRNNHSSLLYQADWTKRAVPEATKLRENKEKLSQHSVSSPVFSLDKNQMVSSNAESSKALDVLEDSPDTFPVGSKSLASLVSVVEAQENKFNLKRSIPKDQNSTEEIKITTQIPTTDIVL